MLCHWVGQQLGGMDSGQGLNKLFKESVWTFSSSWRVSYKEYVGSFLFLSFQRNSPIFSFVLFWVWFGWDSHLWLSQLLTAQRSPGRGFLTIRTVSMTLFMTSTASRWSELCSLRPLLSSPPSRGQWYHFHHYNSRDYFVPPPQSSNRFFHGICFIFPYTALHRTQSLFSSERINFRNCNPRFTRNIFRFNKFVYSFIDFFFIIFCSGYFCYLFFWDHMLGAINNKDKYGPVTWGTCRPIDSPSARENCFRWLGPTLYI